MVPIFSPSIIQESQWSCLGYSNSSRGSYSLLLYLDNRAHAWDPMVGTLLFKFKWLTSPQKHDLGASMVGSGGVPVLGTDLTESDFLSWNLSLEPDFPLSHTEFSTGSLSSAKIIPTTKCILLMLSLKREGFQVYIPVLPGSSLAPKKISTSNPVINSVYQMRIGRVNFVKPAMFC